MSNEELITCRIRMVSGREFTFQLPRSCRIREMLDLHLFPAMEEQGVPLIGVFIELTFDKHTVSRDHILGALPGAQEGNLVELSMILQAWQWRRPPLDRCQGCGWKHMVRGEEQRLANAIRHQQKGLTIYLDAPPLKAVSCVFCLWVAVRCKCHLLGWKHPLSCWWVCPDCSAGRDRKSLRCQIVAQTCPVLPADEVL
jgi:hypothetical protein